jgi:hypothetical protein
MKPEDLSKSQNPDLYGSLAAMRRAAEAARQTAIQTNTALIVVRDGKLTRIPAWQLREQTDCIADDRDAAP